jgi:hypothetical protein
MCPKLNYLKGFNQHSLRRLGFSNVALCHWERISNLKNLLIFNENPVRKTLIKYVDKDRSCKPDIVMVLAMSCVCMPVVSCHENKDILLMGCPITCQVSTEGHIEV